MLFSAWHTMYLLESIFARLVSLSMFLSCSLVRLPPLLMTNPASLDSGYSRRCLVFCSLPSCTSPVLSSLSLSAIATRLSSVYVVGAMRVNTKQKNRARTTSCNGKRPRRTTAQIQGTRRNRAAMGRFLLVVRSAPKQNGASPLRAVYVMWIERHVRGS